MERVVVANTREVWTSVPVHDRCDGPLVVLPAYRNDLHWRVKCPHLRLFDVPRTWVKEGC